MATQTEQNEQLKPETAFEGRMPVEIDPERRPTLSVVVDTEEEFDWSKGFFREKTSVRHLEHIVRVQRIFDEFDICPTYVVDYPVATQPEGTLPLKEILDSGRAEIGAHVHPWVNPPFEEEVSSRHSFPGNLGRDLEARKL
ncbi:MAG: polysaccharide deacetylase family protein, partial [Planctomycetota bacterium]